MSMHRCEKCQLILDDTVQYCPGCGKTLRERKTGARWKNWTPLAAAGIMLVIVLVFAATAARKTTARTSMIHGERESPVLTRTPVSTPSGSTDAAPPATTRETAGSTSVSAPLRTAAELAIKEAAASAPGVSESRAKIDDVIADPRRGVAVVTFSVPAGTTTRTSIQAAAFYVAKGVFAAHNDINFVTVRCLVSAGSAAGTQMAFVADAARAVVEALGRSPLPKQMETVFTDSWWNPRIQ